MEQLLNGRRDPELYLNNAYVSVTIRRQLIGTKHGDSR